MPKLTLTEALAEIKTLGARIIKKRENVMRYFTRDSRLIDPLAGEGGSRDYVARERQGIRDLEKRLVQLRTLIQEANLRNPLSVGTRTMTVQQWLNWRKEVAHGEKTFLQQMANALNTVRQNAQRQGQTVTDGSAGPGDVVVNTNERELAAEIEELENVLGTLDGKLSLHNATTTINAPEA